MTMKHGVPYDRPIHPIEEAYAMNGSIRCVRCNTGIDEGGDGICPKCKKAKSYFISFYWSEKLGGKAFT